MFNRAEVVDTNFLKFVKEWQLPPGRSQNAFKDSGLTAAEAIDLFESQVISRHLDLQARLLKGKNECFYTIGSSGHEGNAVFGKVFRKTDMAFLHYRSGAMMVQRYKQLAGSTPIYDLLLSFVASSEEPIAGGRHKVFGSLPLLVPPQTSTIASHLPKAVGAALSINRAKDLNLNTVMPDDSVVLCSFGDASANHSTALGAFNTAGWVAYQKIKMPIVFICEDNRIGISVKTPERWIERSFSSRPEINYIKCDGLNLFDVYIKTKQAEKIAREQRRPVFLHMETVRLLGHAGSDVESTYNSISEIEKSEFDDPLLHSSRLLIENNILTQDQAIDIYESMRERIQAVANYVITRPKLLSSKDVAATIINTKKLQEAPKLLDDKEREKIWGRDFEKRDKPHHMAKLINWGLTDIMAQYPNTLVFGEDVAKKGGVYHVTDGLLAKFSHKRVFNSPLDEQAIIGAALGFAHNGFLPIPEVQFLAYIHNAEDQVRGEGSTLSFFSQGQFNNPMVLRIAGLAYQKGFGGHFHNDNSLAVFRDIPGVIIAVPSNGADAVRMMRTCVKHAYEYGRVVVFVEPIALYMTRDLHQEGDKKWSFPYPELSEAVELGEFATYGSGKDLTILTYGNGTYYSLQAVKELEQKHNIKTKVIDLRWIAPLEKEKILAELKESKHVVVVEECRKTGSFGEALLALMVEYMRPLPPVKLIAAEDCFIPLGLAATSGLPDKESIIRGCEELIGITK